MFRRGNMRERPMQNTKKMPILKNVDELILELENESSLVAPSPAPTPAPSCLVSGH